MAAESRPDREATDSTGGRAGAQVDNPGFGHRDGRVFGAVIGGSLLLIVALAVVARGGESAGGPGPVRIPTPALSTSEACETWARYWTEESGVDADPASLEAFSNCRQGEDGSWFVPIGRADPRLSGPPILTEEEQVRTNETRQLLLDQIAALEREFQRGLERQLEGIYSRVPEPVIGHIEDRDSLTISPVRNRYTRIMQAFLLDPENIPLASYVGWLMGTRAAGFEAFQQRCHQEDLQYLWAACDGLSGSLSVYNPPWPWDLKDTLTLDGYLDWALANDALPPDPTISETPDRAT
ncbi:MAG: hypothetical protein ACRDJH_00045 [Thermomicrobiales bacterium]